MFCTRARIVQLCLLLPICLAVSAETRVVSFSRSAQAMVVEHEGQLRVLQAGDRKALPKLVLERVDGDKAQVRFTGMQVADVIARVERGADLAALRLRFDQPVALQAQPVPVVLPQDQPRQVKSRLPPAKGQTDVRQPGSRR